MEQPQLAKNIIRNNKKQLIINTAFELISQNGIENFSMKKLCQKMGMAQSGIFYYFSGLNKLLEELIKRQVINETSYLLAQIQLTKKPKKALKHLFISYIEYYANRPSLYKLVHLDPPLSKELSDFINDQYQDVKIYLNHITNDDIVRRKTTFDLALKSLLISCNGLVSYFLSNKEFLDKETKNDLVEQTWKIYSHSIYSI